MVKEAVTQLAFLKTRGGNRTRKKQSYFELPGLIGVDYISSPFNLAPNISPNAWNCDMGNPIGVASKAPAYELLIPSLGNGGIKGLHAWPHSTGDKMMAAHGKNLYLISGTSNSIAKTSQADWEAGTRTHIDTATSSGDMLIEKPGSNYSNTATNTSDFNGIHSNTEAADNLVRLTSAPALNGITSVTPGSTWYHDYEEAGTSIGYKFTVRSQGARVDKLRMYSYSSKTYTVRLWDMNGNQLTSANISCTANQWSETTLGSYVNLAANTAYVISFDLAEGNPDTYYYTVSSITTSGLFTYNEARTGPYQGFPNSPATYMSFPGILDIHAVQAYSFSGTYTHGVLDISSSKVNASATITYNKSTPSNTAVAVETRYSLNGGSSYTAWTTRNSGDAIIPAGTDISNARVQWRSILTTSDGLNTPSLNDATISVTAGYYDEATWISPVYDLGNTPISNVLSWSQTTPSNCAVTWYAQGSSNGSIFGDWREITNSGDSIPLQRYIKIKAVLTGPLTATPTVNSLLISYSTGYTVPYLLDIGPLGRTNNELTGNRVCFVDYEDWLLCADGDRPFLVYLTTTTQRTGTAAGGATTYITLDSGASSVNDFYNNAFITITGGTGAGQTRWINDYEGSTKKVYPSTAFSPAPDATSTFSIGSAIKVRQLGVDPPATALTATASSTSGSPNGTYYYKVTYVNADGIESNPGPASTSVTVSSKQINLTNIPVDSSTGNTTTKRRIYRTAAGGSVYKYLTEISDNTTTTYTDNTADAALGSLMLDNNNVPPNAILMYQFTSYVFYVGTDGYSVWFSKAGEPDHVPNITGDIQVIMFPGKVADIKSHPMALIMAGPTFQASITSNSGFIFDSDPAVDTTTMKIIDSNGGLSFMASAMCLSPDLRSTLIMNTNTGLRAVVPGLQDNSVESIPLSYEIQPFYERSINRDQAAGVFFNNYYHYTMEYMAEDAAASEFLTFAYDMRTKKWYGPWQWAGMACYTISGNVLYAGDAQDGKIYRLYSGSTYAGNPIYMKADWPPQAPAGMRGTCRFRRYHLIPSSDSVTDETYIKLKVDKKSSSIGVGPLIDAYTGDNFPGHDFIRPSKKNRALTGSACSVRIEDNSVNPLKVLKVTIEYDVLNTNR